MRSETDIKATLLFFMVLAASVLLSFSAPAGQADDRFAKANQHYINQDYAAAIEQYENLIRDDFRSVEVYFNLGNAYYKTGDMTRAILNYERAKKLKPSDPDITHNLKIAYMGTIDRIEPSPMVFYEEWWDKFVYEGSVDKRAMLVVVFLWITLIFSAVYFFSSRTTVKKITFFTGLGFLVIALSTWYFTYLQQNHLNSHKAAIIFTDSAYVKSSPDNKSANLFLLHSGTRIDVLDELMGWKKIRIANGNEGWIQTEHIEII